MSCQSQTGLSPILKSVQVGDLNEVKNFIETHHDIDAYHNGYTLLCGAIKTDQIAIITYLINQGADLKKMSNKKTPLMYAAKYGRLEIAKLLIQKGANKNSLSPRGKTALDYAKKYKQTDLILLLSK